MEVKVPETKVKSLQVGDLVVIDRALDKRTALVTETLAGTVSLIDMRTGKRAKYHGEEITEIDLETLSRVINRLFGGKATVFSKDDFVITLERK